MADTQAVLTETDEELNAEIEEEIEKASASNRRYLRPREIVAFLLTTFGQKNLQQFVDSNRLFFMVSFLGISGSVYGMIVFLESIYDALDDTLSGLIVDRTRTRWGRLRPYLIITTPFWATAVLMLFTTPSFISGNSQKIIWAVVAIFTYNLGMSYFNAWNILLYNITPNIKERDSLIATSKFFELFGQWLPSLVPIFVTFLPKVNKNIGMQGIYTGFAVAMALIAGCTAIYGFFAIRERVPLASREQMKEIGIIDSFKNVFKNRPMFVLILSGFFNGFKSVGAANESFFWLHNTGSLFNATIAGLFTGLPTYVVIPLTPKLIRKLGAKKTAVLSGIFAGAMYVLLFVIGYAPFGDSSLPKSERFSGVYGVLNLVYLTLMLTLAGLPNGIMRVAGAVLQGDVYDYSEWKYGVRNEALVSTVTNYFGKLANAVTGLLSGVVLTLVGYVSHKDVLGNVVRETDPSVLSGFFVIFALVPAIARFLYGISLIFFNVDGKFKDNMLKDLEARRAEKVRLMAQGIKVTNEDLLGTTSEDFKHNDDEPTKSE